MVVNVGLNKLTIGATAYADTYRAVQNIRGFTNWQVLHPSMENDSSSTPFLSKGQPASAQKLNASKTANNAKYFIFA